MSMHAILAAGYVTHTPSGDHLTASEISTLRALALTADPLNLASRATFNTLRDLTGHSLNTIRKALRALEACGYITRYYRPGYYMIYVLNTDALRATRRYSQPVSYELYAPYDTNIELITGSSAYPPAEVVHYGHEPEDDLADLP